MKKQSKLPSSQGNSNLHHFQITKTSHQLTQNELLFEEISAEKVSVFSSDSESILDLFQDTANKLSFIMIEREDTHATAIKNPNKSPASFLNCFNICHQNQVTAVKININGKPNTTKNVCRVRGLVGSVVELNQFFQTFAETTKQIETHQVHFLDDNQRQVRQDPSNPFQLQACAMFKFHQILSDRNSQIANTLKSQVRDFEQSFKNTKQSIELLPLPMKNAITMSHQTVLALEEQLRQNKTMEKIMSYCRISVERFVFDRIQPYLIPIYMERNREVNQIYLQKRSLIFKHLTLKQIYQEVSLTEKLWLVQQQHLSQKFQPQHLSQLLGYDLACEQLSKLKLSNHPREKIKFVEQSYTRLKSMVYERTNRKRELVVMEDIIPIMILLVLLSDISDFRTQLDVINDFLKFDLCDAESEKRVILNLSESLNYVIRDWDMSKFKQQSHCTESTRSADNQ